MNYQLPNFINISSNLAVGGQPSRHQLADAVGMGLQQIINLRPPSEDAGFDEAAEVARLAIGYHCLPIAGRADLTLDNVRQFDALLHVTGNVPTLIHCASGNRVGALFALRAAWLQGADVDTALKLGQQHGLTAMLETVRAVISDKPV